MARILRLSSLQRNVLTCIALFVTINVIVVSQYWGPRRVALSLDEDNEVSNNSHPPPANTSSPRVLLVSGFFPPSKSATLSSTYLDRLPRFLGSITTDVYFYTSPNLASTVRAARGNGLPLTIDTAFTSPFDIPPLKGRQLVYDRMRSDLHQNGSTAHTPELYAFWNAKPFFLEHAAKARKGKQQYDYVFWVDAESFEDEHLYTAWPDPDRLEKIWEDGSRQSGKRKEDLIFYPIINPPSKNTKYWTEDMGPVDADFSEGSFFGGSPSSVLWLSHKFYSYHDYFIQLGYFSAKQRGATINSLLLLDPSRFITVWVYDPEAVARGGLPPDFLNHGYLGSCGSERHYYQWWMSDRETREGMRRRWMGQRQDAMQATWWKLKVPCRFTGVLSVATVLGRTFGQDWRAPIGTVIRPSRTW